MGLPRIGLTISSEQIDAVLSAGMGKSRTYIDDGDREDAALDALMNNAPVIWQREARQDVDYFVVVRGVPGAYFVQALEDDEIGVFSDSSQAIGTAVRTYGEFFVGEA